MSFSKKRTLAHKHLDKKLRFRLRIYFVISLVLVSIMLYEIMAGIVTFPLAILGILIGIFLGFITARMFHLSWDENAKKIVSRLDVLAE